MWHLLVFIVLLVCFVNYIWVTLCLRKTAADVVERKCPGPMRKENDRCPITARGAAPGCRAFGFSDSCKMKSVRMASSHQVAIILPEVPRLTVVIIPCFISRCPG